MSHGEPLSCVGGYVCQGYDEKEVSCIHDYGVSGREDEQEPNLCLNGKESNMSACGYLGLWHRGGRDALQLEKQIDGRSYSDIWGV